MSLSGTVSSGYYSTFSRDVTDTHLDFVPLSLGLDAQGYLGAPGFLSFRVQPMLTEGPQASEAGFLGGNGVTVDTTLLGGRSFPLKLKYGNVKREDVFFGSLNQVSGYRSNNHEKVYGLNWQLRARKLPQLNLDLTQSDLTTDPQNTLIPAYSTANHGYSLALHDARWGWDIDADVRRTALRSNYGALNSNGLVATRFDQDLEHAGLIAHRSIVRDLGLTLAGGATNNRNVFDAHPYVQDLRYVSGALDAALGTRWKGRVRADYNANLLGADIAGANSPPAVSAAQAPAPMYAVQIGAFADGARAEQLRAAMESRYGRATIVEKPGQPALSRVLVGQETSRTSAETLAARVRRETGAAFVVPLSPAAAALPSASPADGSEPAPFLSYRNRFSNVALEGENHLRLTRDFSLSASVHRERVVPRQDALGVTPSDYLYGSAGAAFQHRFSWASFSGQADGSLGRMIYAGVPNRYQGRSWSFSAQRGTVDGLELSASYNDSRQRARQATTLDSGSSGGELGIGRRFAAVIFRGGAGLNRSRFRDPVLNYRSTGLVFHGALQHRLFNASYSRNRSSGNTLSEYFVTPISSPSATGFLIGTPLRATLYANTGDTLVVRASPFRRFEISFIRMRGQQRFDSQTVNDYDQMEARASFRFRLLAFEAGYVKYTQSLLALSNTLRSRYYFRVSRTFGIIGAQ